MKIEKRTAGFTEEELEEQALTGEEAGAAENTPEEASAGRKKPVLTYILILFIAAFLLMAMSFAMHQRRNAELVGELQERSVSTMQELQASQDQVLALQGELRAAQKEQEALEKSTAEERAAQQQRLDAQQLQIDALTSLYSLQQAYSARDLDACKTILQSMEAGGIQSALAQITAREGITPPAQRYLQLKEAIEARLAD